MPFPQRGTDVLLPRRPCAPDRAPRLPRVRAQVRCMQARARWEGALARVPGWSGGASKGGQ
eukprot:15210196-Alexandrium_andersonii.AAC.1